MTKVPFHGSIKGLRGRIGNLIFRQMPDGTTVVTQAPPEKTSEEKGQAVYAELAAVTPMKTAYNFAMSDWLKPPEAQRILVEATDNVMVTRVQITVLDENAQVLEKGEATRKEGDCWEFVSNAAGTSIVAEAWNLARNVTNRGVDWQSATHHKSYSLQGSAHW